MLVCIISSFYSLLMLTVVEEKCIWIYTNFIHSNNRKVQRRIRSFKKNLCNFLCLQSIKQYPSLFQWTKNVTIANKIDLDSDTAQDAEVHIHKKYSAKTSACKLNALFKPYLLYTESPKNWKLSSKSHLFLPNEIRRREKFELEEPLFSPKSLTFREN